MTTVNGTIPEECDVLRVCLERFGTGQRQVVLPVTGVGRDGDPTQDQLRGIGDRVASEIPALSMETVADFAAKNGQPYPVDPDFLLDGRLVPVPGEAMRRIFDGGAGWDELERQFPESSGIVDFSRVGFNVAVTEALLYMGKSMDVLAGYGAYVIFRKRDGVWIEQGSVMAWVS